MTFVVGPKRAQRSITISECRVDLRTIDRIPVRISFFLSKEGNKIDTSSSSQSSMNEHRSALMFPIEMRVGSRDDVFIDVPLKEENIWEIPLSYGKTSRPEKKCLRFVIWLHGCG
jgi:hypothetical protein